MTTALSRIEQIKADARTLVRDLKISGEQAELRHEVLASIPSRPPAKGWLSSAFGVRQSPFHSGEKMHNGVDIAADVGTPVFATADGVVTFAGLNGGYGKYLRINHGFGISTRFAHSGELLVKKGQRIRRGDQIAVIGLTGRTTGPHVHYEVLIHDQPVDPEQFFIEATLAKEPAPLALAAASAPMGGDTDLPQEEAADADHGWRSMGLAGERLLFASSLPGVLGRTTTTDVMFFAALLLMLTIASSLVRLGEPKAQPLTVAFTPRRGETSPKRSSPSPYGLGIWANSEADDDDEEAA